LDRESRHLAPLLCHDHRGGKTSIGTTMFGRLFARASTRLLRGGGRSEAASSRARAVQCSKSLSSTAPHMRSKISMGHYCPHGQLGQRTKRDKDPG
jgi:hypothetical protein